ncbi:divisome protein SepX/GlpR [Actinomycetospora sp. CA-101289]|uniref:divisome protein SepX/GlpR n=1 Tax=Actinomycetospora sp. CA-101289 TaxID=3239893 RepID=UPI003D99BA5B
MFAALVLAWLVVLVPVVARRRQMVPRYADADLSARVLPRTAGAPLIEEAPVTTTPTNGRGDRTAVAGAPSGATAVSAGTATALAERADETPEAVDAELDLDAELDADLDEDELDELDEPDGVVAVGEAPRPRRERVLPRRAPEAERVDDEYDEYDEYDDDEDDDEAYYEDADDLRDDEPVGRELRPYRPGRGGFDPDAAEAAAHARYAFRQRVALGLIAVAVLSALAAMVVSSAMWWLHAVADVVLIGYLVFLRRQTRIEEEVRVRRAARLSGERRALEARRARQAEHDARMAALRDEDWIDADVEEDDLRDDDLDDLDDDRYGVDHRDATPRWAAPRTPAPKVPEDLELVDDTDDDPAFHDLDGERSYGYRRAAGA